MLTTRRSKRRGGQRGFTLLEVVIAMTTLAIGLTGNYLMFARSMQQQQHGTYQSRAVTLARGVAAGLQAGQAPEFADPVLCNNHDARACAALDWLTVTERRWQALIAGSLPNGRLQVQRGAGGNISIAVQWQDALSLRPSVYQVRLDRP